MNHSVVGAFATLAAGAILVAVLLPPAALPAAAEPSPSRYPTARGAYHVHSQRSDGTGTLDEIAAAAADARLDFVIVTDHGDGTREPEPPSYRSGVLVLDGVEIGTTAGHYVVVDLPQAPYPLAGSPETVIEDVKRLGGFGIAAHPDSAKPRLRWTAWNARLDGIEWLNADSEWRDELWGSLGRSLVTYAFRPAETLAALLDRPAQTLQRWDGLARRARIVALAGADAHARLGYRQAVDPYEDRVLARIPGYASSFRTFQNHLVLDRPLGGIAREDAATLLRAIRGGRAYTTVDGLAAAGDFDFSALSGRTRAEMGEYLDLGEHAVIEARVTAPRGTTLTLFRDGHAIYDTTTSSIRIDVGTQEGVYRVEAQLPSVEGRDGVPWLVSNPIYVGLRGAHEAAERDRLPRRAATTARSAVDTSRWRSEASPGSTSAADLGRPGDGKPAVAWRFALSTAGGSTPYAALQFPRDGEAAAFDRILLTARADRPMRLWVQLRSPANGERWGQTFYVDDITRDVVLPFDDFEPIGPTSSSVPPLPSIDSLLIVADTLNSPSDARGELHIRELWLGK